MRIAILVSSLVVTAGLIWVLVVETLLGAVLVVGGVAGLFWSVFPAATKTLVTFLSGGSVRRRWPD